MTRRTFREFTSGLTDGRFFLCNRGLIVNLEHAADFDGTDFILKNGKMQQARYDNLRTAIAETREARHDMPTILTPCRDLPGKRSVTAL